VCQGAKVNKYLRYHLCSLQLMPNSHRLDISIIIPTFNRASALKWCLQYLNAQTFRNFEVVIVDDGSTDDTADVVASFKAEKLLDITYMRQQNAGPAKARNAAVNVVRSPICLFIGDDIFGTPHFVEKHYELHQQKTDLATCGLGLTRWDYEKQKLTPFMLFFEDIQFGYSQLAVGTPPDWRYFYTSNLSVKTGLLRQYPFDERFTKAAMEDIELGYRISRSENLKIDFLPQALAFHYHPTTLRQACRRSMTVGCSIRVFEQCWPEANVDFISRSLFKNTLKQIIGLFPLRVILAGVLSWVARFYCNAYLTRVLLSSYTLVGYKKCEARSIVKKSS
jgi:glycosyltransferase involved in cell wall biosynthesis